MPNGRTRLTGRLIAVGLPLLAVGALTAACSSSGGKPPAAASGASVTASGSSATAPAGALTITVVGGHLTDGSSRTLYLWVADKGGTSSCSGTCATVWAPVPGPATPAAGSGVSAAQLSTITRSDGTRQVVYAGHPLYYFAEDGAAGSAKGEGSDGFGAKWWEVSASGQAVTTSDAPSAPTTSASPSGRGGGYGY
jgi:predicted lipoprotein with Yx(FWY)xxD motif